MDDVNRGPDVDVFRSRYELDASETVCAAVVRAVAAVSGDEPYTVQPLYEAVDPDALEHLVRSLETTDERDACWSITFPLHRCQVTLASDGVIELRASVPTTERHGHEEDSG